jgi:ribose 1,5-bisphosphokinase
VNGIFVAVIGPSGSGKDSILEAARLALTGQDDIVFARRRITRPASAGEDHTPVSEDEFGAAHSRGEFALTWQAHGLWYGIPAHLVDVVASGGVVVANVSRGVLDRLPTVFANVAVARVTVSDEVRLARILARGREDASAAVARVQRLDPAPNFSVDLEIVNDGTLDEASATFAAFLRQVRDTVRAPR